MDRYYPFEKFLEEFARNYKRFRYHTDIMYKAKMFNQHQRNYKFYIKDNNLVGNYDDVESEILEYEKRIKDSKY